MVSHLIKTPRQITDEEVKYLISLKPTDISMSVLKSLFGRTIKNPVPKFNLFDYFILPENTCCKNLEGLTTVGAYIWNRAVLDTDFSDIIGYVNTPITGDNMSKIYDLISDALFQDKIVAEQFWNLIDTLEWLGGGDLCELINTSLSNRLYTLPPIVRKRRDELFKKYEKEIEAGDVIIGTKIEEELTELAKQELSKLPEWDNFASGAKLNFGNNYKTVMIMKGPILNTGTGKWGIAKSNYDDGIKKEEYAMFADSAVYGTYQRAKGVAIGGYTVKKFIASLQEVVTAEYGSDCNSHEYLEVFIDPYFKEELLYMNIIESSGKFVLLTPDNFSKYVGKTVRMRSPMYCKHSLPQICNKCIGEHPYKINLKMVGFAATKAGSTLMNKRLKAFHNKKVHLYKISIDDLLG